MNKVTKTVTAPVRFVSKHRVAVAVVATSAFWIYVNKNNMEQTNEFLKAHDLYDQFYALSEDL